MKKAALILVLLAIIPLASACSRGLHVFAAGLIVGAAVVDALDDDVVVIEEHHHHHVDHHYVERTSHPHANRFNRPTNHR